MDRTAYRSELRIGRQLLRRGRVGQLECPIALAILEETEVKSVMVGVPMLPVETKTFNSTDNKLIIINQGTLAETSFVMTPQLALFTEAYDRVMSGISRDTSLIKPFTLILDYFYLEASMTEAKENKCQKITVPKPNCLNRLYSHIG